MRSPPCETLTPRERDILCQLVYGRTNTEIAMHLGLTQDTAREYIARLYTKMDVHRRSALIDKAMDMGLLEIAFNWEVPASCSAPRSSGDRQGGESDAPARVNSV